MSWKIEYVILLLISTLVDYFTGIHIYKSKNSLKRKLLLYLSLLVNLGILFSFKYFNFANETLRQILANVSIPFQPITLTILLPIGISFYTFQSMSYSIDIYRKKIKPEKHFGIFAVYISFFPQLVAGPIERAKHLIPQLKKKIFFDSDRSVQAIKLILWGFFQKIVIADNLAILVDQVYSSSSPNGLEIIIATIFFGFQIYCDFSGYTNIARGSAKFMGIDIIENFRTPYFAASIHDFWKRWHISLTSWFKDYVYIPLGGNKVRKNRYFANILIVFLVSGLWHGANFTFIAWGFLHGVYFVIAKLTKNIRKVILGIFGITKTPKFLKIAITFSFVTFAWIFFRSQSIDQAKLFISKILFDLKNILVGRIPLTSFDSYSFYLGIILISVLLLTEIIKIKFPSNYTLKSPKVQFILYIILTLSILLFGVFEKNEFIYFQF